MEVKIHDGLTTDALVPEDFHPTPIDTAGFSSSTPKYLKHLTQLKNRIALD